MSHSFELRAELSQRAEAYARRHAIPYVLSLGESPTVLFEPYDNDRRHGNFLPRTYGALLAHDPWRRRLNKRHPMFKRMPRNERGHWNELDSSASSDALLMNVFCYPGTLRDGQVAKMLGEEPEAPLQFGFKARVPLVSGHADRTEVDLQLGGLLVEAKLTENDFQRKQKSVVEGYRDFAEVFDPQTLAADTRGLSGLSAHAQRAGCARHRMLVLCALRYAAP